jgi:hypothetical protein
MIKNEIFKAKQLVDNYGYDKSLEIVNETIIEKMYSSTQTFWKSVKEQLIIMKGKKELCVLCGGETPYVFETPIQERIGYVEGAGQTCSYCQGTF